MINELIYVPLTPANSFNKYVTQIPSKTSLVKRFEGRNHYILRDRFYTSVYVAQPNKQAT